MNMDFSGTSIRKVISYTICVPSIHIYVNLDVALVNYEKVPVAICIILQRLHYFMIMYELSGIQCLLFYYLAAPILQMLI